MMRSTKLEDMFNYYRVVCLKGDYFRASAIMSGYLADRGIAAKIKCVLNIH